MVINFQSLVILTVFLISSSAIKAQSDDEYIMDFNCSSYLSDGNMIAAVGQLNLTTHLGIVESSLIDPNTGSSSRTLRINLSDKNLTEVEDNKSPYYEVKEYIKGAQLNFNFRLPVKVTDVMADLIIDGLSYELLCDKGIRQVDELPPTDEGQELND